MKNIKQYPSLSKNLTHHLFEIKANWTKQHFIGFLSSWSSAQHYISINGNNLVELIQDRLKEHWPDGVEREVTFPLFIRVGEILK